MMLIKAEIDLNYIDMHPSNIEIFGWKLDHPLIINIEVNETRMINSIKDEEFKFMSFASMADRKVLNYSFSNDSSD
jgi:hypothetical protein